MSEQKGKRKGRDHDFIGVSGFHLTRENELNSKSLIAAPTNLDYCKTTLIFLVLSPSIAQHSLQNWAQDS